MTTLTGSSLIALAVALGEMDVEAAGRPPMSTRTIKYSAWGADEEVTARRARRLVEMKAAARIAEFFAGAA